MKGPLPFRSLERIRVELAAELRIELAELLDQELAELRHHIAELDRRLTDTHRAALKLVTDHLNRR